MYTLREYKYLAPKDRMNEIRKAFMPYLKIDNFLEKEGKSDYYVHTLYFDTEQLNFYSEKLAGVEIRKKLRVRAYNSLTDDSVVFLEVKQKEGDKIKKKRAPLHYNRLKNFLSYGNIETDILYGEQYPNARNNARKFLYYYYGQNLMPVVLRFRSEGEVILYMVEESPAPVGSEIISHAKSPRREWNRFFLLILTLRLCVRFSSFS